MILAPDERQDLIPDRAHPAQALGFYRDVLGFKVREDVELAGIRWVSVRPPSQPDVQIILTPPDMHHGVSPADRHAIEDLMAKGLLGRLVFVTDNCDATFEHIEATGAEVVQEPINQPHGVRDCAFRDPSGNMLRFTQPHSRQARHPPHSRHTPPETTKP